MKYDLTSLAPTDFEYLCNALLAAELQVHVESFTEGRDGGIDGRFFAKGNKKHIVQAKHFAKSGFSRLKSKIKSQAEQITELAADRYFLFTSVALTPQNKDELIIASANNIQFPSDIYGANDIEALLIQHKNIVKQFYQLWLPQSPILEVFLKEIFNKEIFTYTTTIIEEAREKAPTYHKISDYNKAYNILEENNVLLIHGNAGVGKTALAQQLFLEYVANGYKPCAIRENIDDFYKMFEAKEKQVFYFDDCWGSNFMNVLTEKKDEHIVKFIDKIISSKNKRLILTSRTNIHDEVFQRTESIYSKKLQSKEYLIKLDNYSLKEKAYILYYFLWKSEIELDYLTIIIKDKVYDTIIRHKNYNPRLLEHITKKDYIQANSPEEYKEYIQNCLNDPTLVYKKAYNEQLTQLSRVILDLVVLSGGDIPEENLAQAYDTWKANNKYNIPNYPIDFESVVQGMLRSFIVRTKNMSNVTYNVFNPSIADMIIDKYLLSAKIEYFKYLDTYNDSRGLNFLASLSTKSLALSSSLIKEYLSSRIVSLLQSEDQFEGFIRCINVLPLDDKIEFVSEEIFLLLEQKKILSNYEFFAYILIEIYFELANYYSSSGYNRNQFIINVLEVIDGIDELEVVSEYYKNENYRKDLVSALNYKEFTQVFHEKLFEIWEGYYLEDFIRDHVGDCIEEVVRTYYDEDYADIHYTVDEDKLIDLILKNDENLYIRLDRKDVQVLLENIDVEDYIDRSVDYDEYKNYREDDIPVSTVNSYDESLFVDIVETKYR